MRYISTRNKNDIATFSEAIVRGLSKDGGLYVPETFPQVSQDEMNEMLSMNYDERANLILSKFMPDFTMEEIAECTAKAYDKFDGETAPVVKMDEGLYLLELFHGPTIAFKDMALALFPHVLSKAKKKVGINEEIVILVATSGDTGKAALEGFKDADGIKILVFYPTGGVSNMQKLQMSTADGKNVGVASIKGNFDDAQTGVKEIFENSELKEMMKEKGYIFSSANSINLGRLLPQVVYYFSAYLDLVGSNEIEMGDEVNFTIPTGNFGNILAGYYAKQMGLNIKKLVCASNQNNVLTDFFSSGKYDAKRKFYKTISPSMDILVSSNLERLLFEISGRDDKLTFERMKDLKSKGDYTISKEEMDKISGLFYASFSSEEDTEVTISQFYDEYGYALDPHTAVGVYVSDTYCATKNDYDPMIILSTASPFKFNDYVLKALRAKVTDDPFKNAKTLKNMSAMDIPEAISELQTKEVRFNKIYEKEELVKALNDFLDGKLEIDEEV